MSWKFGGLILQKDYSKNIESVFESLGRSQSFTGTILSFQESLGIKESRSSVGVVNQNTILFNEFLPYDCSFTSGKESSFDKKLASLSKEMTLLVFLLDGGSDTYGFSLFENGERKRRWATAGGDILCNDGDHLQEESSFISGIDDAGTFNSEQEARVIKVFEEFVNADFSLLLRNDQLKFYVFT